MNFLFDNDLLQSQTRQEASILSYQLNFAGRTAVNLADIVESMPVYACLEDQLNRQPRSAAI